MSTDNTTPTTPEVYHSDAGRDVSGAVFEGRGQEIHGVPMGGTPDPIVRGEGTELVLVEDVPPVEPVPVVIVRTGGLDFNRARVQRMYGSAQVAQVVGRDESRQKVRIRNLSAVATDRVWISFAQHTANANLGYPLDPNAELILDTENEIYCLADPLSATVIAGGLIGMAVLVEYAVREQ